MYDLYVINAPKHFIDSCGNGDYVQPMTDDTLSIRFEMRSSPDWIAAVDDWRRKQKTIPSRAEAIRTLVSQSLENKEKRKTPAATVQDSLF